MEERGLELESRLGFRLPEDYREFLVANHQRLLDSALAFLPPRSGVINYLLTVEDILENDEKNRIGIPAESLLHIGHDIMGGYLYLKVSEKDFGEIQYSERYQIREKFPSFSAFLNETEPMS
ncbi:SMI1/KNR4 family protein [Luteolibacter flavescens]|uniref:SMI1/KNR4 family protein n=1 Tax=Luteolibacter flavescens TaxID=1859460 RepID=A0ABT3FKL1_9BACT|nr:SMI1/KNR4 family protein [Luteolibacter flavescens]MCW1884098.1 SMI1/KNR4 family protein [Luteolibacter flavescens]